MEYQSRRQFLKMIGAAGALSILPGCGDNGSNRSPNKGKPNIVLVITDDQGYGDLACHGNKIIKTPNMDKLHSQSVRLTNFHVGPTCAPTRAALMTGRYCNRTGVWHTVMGRSLMRADEVTIADVLKPHGYKTAIFGKWHLGDNFPFRPQDRGFDEVLIHGGGGVTQAHDYWGNDYFDDTYLHNGKPQKYKGYCTDVWFAEAMKFIKENKNEPFFCYLATNAPHGPFHIAQKYIDMYKDNKDVPSPNFYGMITNIDENIAKLRKKIKRLGLNDNTIFIFMTDNGSAAGVELDKKDFVTKGYNAGMRGKKSSEYEGGHRVPCFIYWPDGNIKGGKDISHLTAHIDLLPTLLDLCDLEKPAEIKFDGTSLKPLLSGADNWPDRTIVTDSQRLDHPVKWRKNATMTDRWRLVNGDELYDITTDPGQKNDIAAQHPDVVANLRTEYDKWWQSVSQRFDEYCEIVIGSKEDPTRILAHDWHGPTIPPFNQIKIRNAAKNNGFWAIKVAQTGEYDIQLRRWPIEADAPITASLPAGGPIPGGDPYPKGKALSITKARLKIANIDMTKTVQPDDKAITFRVNLKAGSTRMQTWLTDKKDKTRGAYYVYVKKIKK